MTSNVFKVLVRFFYVHHPKMTNGGELLRNGSQFWDFPATTEDDGYWMTTEFVTSVDILNVSYNNHTNSSELADLQFPAYMSVWTTTACALIFLVGLIGNSLVPVVIWNNRELRNSTNLFLLNLSLADILILCVCMPTVIAEINTRPDVWIFGEFMCKAVPFVEHMVAHVSVLTILAISFERYYVIVKPLRAGYTCTRMRAFVIILTIWVTGCLSTSPLLFISIYEEQEGSDGSGFCVTTAQNVWSSFFFISAVFLFFFLPMVILVIIYTIIARHLVAEPCSMRSRLQANPNLRARKQVVGMLGTVVAFFFVCLLPLRVFILYIILSEEDVTWLGFEAYYNILNSFRVLAYVNSAINPILYNAMSSKFRQAFLKALGITRGRRTLKYLSRQSTFNTTTSTNSTSMGPFSRHRGGVTCELIKSSLAAKELIYSQNGDLNARYGRRGSFYTNGVPLIRQDTRSSTMLTHQDSRISIRSNNDYHIREKAIHNCVAELLRDSTV